MLILVQVYLTLPHALTGKRYHTLTAHTSRSYTTLAE